MDLSVTLIIAVASALVGLLCTWLLLVALVRLRKVGKGKGALGDTPADLRLFARNQALSAVVMFALAAFIVFFS
jgi:large-conductance mechanosensitive channel